MKTLFYGLFQTFHQRLSFYPSTRFLLKATLCVFLFSVWSTTASLAAVAPLVESWSKLVTTPWFDKSSESKCEDEFNCTDDELVNSYSSLKFGSKTLYEEAHILSQEESCPTALMNQFLRDCDTFPGGVVDSAHEKSKKNCLPPQTQKGKPPLSNAQLEKQIRSKMPSDIPEIARCLDMPFTPEPFKVEANIDELKKLPEERHQSFITEYYTTAQRLQDRYKNGLQNIAYINQLIGKEKLQINCDLAISSQLKDECEQLQACDSGKKIQENFNSRVEGTTDALIALEEIKKELAEECINPKYKYECANREGEDLQHFVNFRRSIREDFLITEGVCGDYLATEKSLKSMYPWIVGNEFKTIMKKRDALWGGKSIYRKIRESFHSEEKLTEEKLEALKKEINQTVAQGMEKQLEDTRSKLRDGVQKTALTYNCVIKNKKCKNIKDPSLTEDLFPDKEGKMSNIQKVVLSSPPIAADLLPHTLSEDEKTISLIEKPIYSEGDDPLPYYFHQAQCRLDARKEAEDNQNFVEIIALDAAILAGTIILFIPTGGTAVAGTAVLRAGLTAVRVGIGAAQAGTVGWLADETYKECNKSHQMNHDSPQQNNMCKKLSMSVQHTTDMSRCITNAAFTVLGGASALAPFLARALKLGSSQSTAARAADDVAEVAARAADDVAEVADDVAEAAARGAGNAEDLRKAFEAAARRETNNPGGWTGGVKPNILSRTGQQIKNHPKKIAGVVVAGVATAGYVLDDSSTVVENPGGGDNSSTVVENPGGGDNSSTVVENPGGGDNSSTVVVDSKEVKTVKACSSGLKLGSYMSGICSLKNKIQQLDSEILIYRNFNQKIMQQMWSGVQNNQISPYFISDMERFMQNKKIMTPHSQHMSRYMRNISVLQGRINNDSAQKIKDIRNDLHRQFQQCLDNPQCDRDSETIKSLRERIKILDELTRA